MIADQSFPFLFFRERIRKDRILVQGTILECYQTQFHVPNAQWNQTNQNLGVWSREMYIAGPCEQSGWLMLRKPRTLQTPKGFSKAFLKGRWGSGESQGVWSAHAQFSNWLMVRYQFLGAHKSGAHLYQAVNFFHLVVVLASINQLRKCYLGTSERRSDSRWYGGGFCPQMAP